ncbi:MAG TPA: bifunctional riboflavin kinase/FAD synthetase [Usitatibacter sp.]|jgi:riboflavin kinase/FMN adenylyltransferase|nr:bifunctional riboflavin kinase/FAD synthetase [Usitatibacter sp.]
MRIVRHARAGGPPTAVAIGSFDGVHRGHAAILDRLRAAAGARGLAPAVLTFEPLPREFLAPANAPPRLTSLAERLAEIARHGIAIAFVERFGRRFACLDAEAFARRLADEYGARHVLVGEDFRYGAGRLGDVATLRRAGERLGFTVEVLPAVCEEGERISSTRVREALGHADFAEAARLLGRRYAICGRVVHGAKRGKALGFPTANVRLARPRTALAGIFAVKCHGVATRGLEGVASLGFNPAVQVGGPATLEAFLFDFSGDLYGRRICIEFVKKLRDEAHFASLAELAAQIARDCEAARAHFRAEP